MSLFSIRYRINQYRPRVYQFETKSPQEEPKPIYLKTLTVGQECLRPDFAGPGDPHPSRSERLP
jgi:hypothetical protein